MKRLIYLMMLLGMSLTLNACSSDDDEPDKPQTEQSDEPSTDPDEPNSPDSNPDSEKTLIVYYSFTNNVHTIVNDLRTQTEADVVRVEPAEKGIDYAANNYAAGSVLIQAIRDNPNSATSYPAIDPVEVDFEEYGTVIVATPLWWSNMAAPLQSFLFSHGAEMAGKNIGLIVSSASSGISGVEADAKRLIPDGKFLMPSLWIRSSQTSSCHSMIEEWLEDVAYNELSVAYFSATGTTGSHAVQ